MKEGVVMDTKHETFDDNKNRGFKKRSWFAIVLLFSVSLGIVVFYLVESKNLAPAIASQGQKDYSILIDQWNAGVIKGGLQDEYLLPKSDNNRLIVQLNKLLGPYTANKQKQSRCYYKRETNSALSIPLDEYCYFLSSNVTNTIVQLDITMVEDEVVKKIKSITHHLSIDTNMILDVLMSTVSVYILSIIFNNFTKKDLPEILQHIYSTQRYLMDLTEYLCISF